MSLKKNTPIPGSAAMITRLLEEHERMDRVLKATVASKNHPRQGRAVPAMLLKLFPD